MQIPTCCSHVSLLSLSGFALQDLQGCVEQLCSLGKPQRLGFWLPAERKHVHGGQQRTIPGHRHTHKHKSLRSLRWTSVCQRVACPTAVWTGLGDFLDVRR